MRRTVDLPSLSGTLLKDASIITGGGAFDLSEWSRRFTAGSLGLNTRRGLRCGPALGDAEPDVHHQSGATCRFYLDADRQHEDGGARGNGRLLRFGAARYLRVQQLPAAGGDDLRRQRCGDRRAAKFLNITSTEAQSRFPFIDQKPRSGNFAPYSVSWNLELERAITSYLTMRARYLSSDANNQITLAPQITADWSALVLGGSGTGQNRQAELTAGVGSSKQRQFYFSYVRQFARGDFSDASGISGTSPFPWFAHASRRVRQEKFPTDFSCGAHRSCPGACESRRVLSCVTAFPTSLQMFCKITFP